MTVGRILLGILRSVKTLAYIHRIQCFRMAQRSHIIFRVIVIEVFDWQHEFRFSYRISVQKSKYSYCLGKRSLGIWDSMNIWCVFDGKGCHFAISGPIVNEFYTQITRKILLLFATIGRNNYGQSGYLLFFFGVSGFLPMRLWGPKAIVEGVVALTAATTWVYAF